MDPKEIEVYATIPSKPFQISLSQYLKTIQLADGSFTYEDCNLDREDNFQCSCHKIASESVSTSPASSRELSTSINQPSTRIKIKRLPRTADQKSTASKSTQSPLFMHQIASIQHSEVLSSMGLSHWPKSSGNSSQTTGTKSRLSDSMTDVHKYTPDIVPVGYAQYAPHFRQVEHETTARSSMSDNNPTSLQQYSQFPTQQLAYHNWFSSQVHPVSGTISHPQQYWTSYHTCPASLPKPNGLQLWWNASAVEYMLYKRWHADLICTSQYNPLVKVITQTDLVRNQRVFKPPLLQVLPPNLGLIAKPRNPKIMRSLRITAVSNEYLEPYVTSPDLSLRQNNLAPTNFTQLSTILTHNNPTHHNLDQNRHGILDSIDLSFSTPDPFNLTDTSSAPLLPPPQPTTSIDTTLPLNFADQSTVQRITHQPSLTFLDHPGVPELYPYLCLYTARDITTTLKNEEERVPDNPYEAHLVHNSHFSSNFPPINLFQSSTPHYPNNNQSPYFPPTVVSTFQKDKVVSQDIPHLKSFTQLTGSKLYTQRSFHGLCLVLSARVATEYAAGMQPSHNQSAPTQVPSQLPTIHPTPAQWSKVINPLSDLNGQSVSDVHYLPLGNAFPYIIKQLSPTTTSHNSSSNSSRNPHATLNQYVDNQVDEQFYAAHSLTDAVLYQNPSLSPHFPTPHSKTTQPSESLHVVLLTWQHRFVILEIPPSHQASLLPHLQPNSVIWLSGESYGINQHIQAYAKQSLDNSQPLPDQPQLNRFHDSHINSINFVGFRPSRFDKAIRSTVELLNEINEEGQAKSDLLHTSLPPSPFTASSIQSNSNRTNSAPDVEIQDTIAMSSNHFDIITHPQIFTHRQVLVSIPSTALTRCPIITPTKLSDVTILVQAGKLASKFYESVCRESVYALASSSNTSILPHQMFPYMRHMDQFLEGQAGALMQPLQSHIFHTDHRFAHPMTFYTAEKVFLNRAKVVKSIGVEKDDGRSSWISNEDSDLDDDFDGRPDHIFSTSAITDQRYPSFTHVKNALAQIAQVQAQDGASVHEIGLDLDSDLLNKYSDSKSDHKPLTPASILAALLHKCPNFHTLQDLLKQLTKPAHNEDGSISPPSSVKKPIIAMMNQLSIKTNVLSTANINAFGYKTTNLLSSMGVDKNVVLHVPNLPALLSSHHYSLQSTLHQYNAFQCLSPIVRKLNPPKQSTHALSQQQTQSQPFIPLGFQLHQSVQQLFSMFLKAFDPESAQKSSSRTASQQASQQFQSLYHKYPYLIPPFTDLHTFPSISQPLRLSAQLPDIDDNSLLYPVQTVHYNSNRAGALVQAQLPRPNELSPADEHFPINYPLNLIPCKDIMTSNDRSNTNLLPFQLSTVDLLSISSQFTTQPCSPCPYIISPPNPPANKSTKSRSSHNSNIPTLPHPLSRYTYALSPHLFSSIFFSSQYPLLQYNHISAEQLQAIKPLLYLLSIQHPSLPTLSSPPPDRSNSMSDSVSSSNHSSSTQWNPFYDTFDILATSNNSFIPKEDPALKSLGLQPALLLTPPNIPVKLTDNPAMLHTLFSRDLLTFSHAIDCIKHYNYLTLFPPSTTGSKDKELMKTHVMSPSHPAPNTSITIPPFSLSTPLSTLAFIPHFAKTESSGVVGSSKPVPVANPPPTRAQFNLTAPTPFHQPTSTGLGHRDTLHINETSTATSAFPHLTPSSSFHTTHSTSTAQVHPTHSQTQLTTTHQLTAFPQFLATHLQHLQAPEPPKLPAALHQQIINFTGASNIVSRSPSTIHPPHSRLDINTMSQDPGDVQILSYTIHNPAYRQQFQYLGDQRSFFDSGVFLPDEEDDTFYSDTEFDPSEVYEIGRNDEELDKNNPTDGDSHVEGFSSPNQRSAHPTSTHKSSVVHSLDAQYKQKQQAQLMKLGLDYTNSVILFVEDLDPISNIQDVDLITSVQPNAADLSAALIALKNKEKMLLDLYPHFKSSKRSSKLNNRLVDNSSIKLASSTQLRSKRLTFSKPAPQPLPPRITRRGRPPLASRSARSRMNDMNDDDDDDDDEFDASQDVDQSTEEPTRSTSDQEEDDHGDRKEDTRSDSDGEESLSSDIDESDQQDDKQAEHQRYKNPMTVNNQQSAIANFLLSQKHSPSFYPLLQQIYRTAQSSKQKYILKQFSQSLLPLSSSQAKLNQPLGPDLSSQFSDFYPATLHHGEHHYANFLTPFQRAENQPALNTKPPQPDPPPSISSIEAPPYYHISLTNLLSNSAAPLFKEFNYNNTGHKGNKIFIDHGLHHVTYSGLHTRPYKAERRARLVDEPTARWVICDNPKCMKWRVMGGDDEWNHPKFFCGFHSAAPSEESCAEVDDWIVRCMQGDLEICKQLAQIGVTTIEIFSSRPELLDTIRQIGISFDIDSQTLKRLR